MYIRIPSSEPNSGSGQLNIVAYLPSIGFPLKSSTLIIGYGSRRSPNFTSFWKSN